jgi:hypothetical protein
MKRFLLLFIFCVLACAAKAQTTVTFRQIATTLSVSTNNIATLSNTLSIANYNITDLDARLQNLIFTTTTMSTTIGTISTTLSATVVSVTILMNQSVTTYSITIDGVMVNNSNTLFAVVVKNKGDYILNIRLLSNGDLSGVEIWLNGIRYEPSPVAMQGSYYYNNIISVTDNTTIAVVVFGRYRASVPIYKGSFLKLKKSSMQFLEKILGVGLSHKRLIAIIATSAAIFLVIKFGLSSPTNEQLLALYSTYLFIAVMSLMKTIEGKIAIPNIGELSGKGGEDESK